MQETHSAKEDENQGQQEWNGKIFYSHGTTNSKQGWVFPDKTYFFRDGGKNWIKPPFCRFKLDNTGQNWKKLI